MTLALIITGSALVAFSGFLLWAAAADLRRYTIPNRISAGILAAYILYAGTAAIFPDLYPNINGFGGLITGAAVLIGGAALFAWGLFGGGDVKLLASTAVWAGPALVFELVAITALAGGILALAVMAARAFRKPACAGPAETAAAPALPYGVAIAAGGLYVAARLAESWLAVG